RTRGRSVASDFSRLSFHEESYRLQRRRVNPRSLLQMDPLVLVHPDALHRRATLRAPQWRWILRQRAERALHLLRQHSAHLLDTFDQVAKRCRITVPVLEQRIRSCRCHEPPEGEAEQVEVIHPAEHPE